MAIANTGTNVVVNGNGVTLATLSAATNLKNQGNMIYTVTSNALGSDTNGTFYIDRVDGMVANLSGTGATFIANNFQTLVSVLNNPTTAYIDVRGCKLVMKANAGSPDWVAPMRGDSNTTIVYLNKFTAWSNICPSVNLVGTKLIVTSNIATDAQINKHPDATVTNVELTLNNTTGDNIFGLVSMLKNGKPTSPEGLVITANRGTNVAFYTINLPTAATGLPNGIFDIRKDYQLNTSTNTTTSVIKRCHRRGVINTTATSEYGAMTLTPTYLWVAPYTHQASNGYVGPAYKSQINNIEYIALGSATTDTTVDIIVNRFEPIIYGDNGRVLSDVRIAGYSTDATLTGTTKWTHNHPLQFIGITGTNGKFLIQEPTTINHKVLTEDDYIKASYITLNRANNTVNHRAWEPNCKYVQVFNSGNSTGREQGKQYTSNVNVIYNKPGYISKAGEIYTTRHTSFSVVLSVDNSYVTTANTTGIVVTVSAGTTKNKSVINVRLPARNVTLDEVYKAIVDKYYEYDVLSLGYTIPVYQGSTILEYDNLTFTYENKANTTLSAGTKVTMLRSSTLTQNDLPTIVDALIDVRDGVSVSIIGNVTNFNCTYKIDNTYTTKMNTNSFSFYVPKGSTIYMSLAKEGYKTAYTTITANYPVKSNFNTTTYTQDEIDLTVSGLDVLRNNVTTTYDSTNGMTIYVPTGTYSDVQTKALLHILQNTEDGMKASIDAQAILFSYYPLKVISNTDKVRIVKKADLTTNDKVKLDLDLDDFRVRSDTYSINPELTNGRVQLKQLGGNNLDLKLVADVIIDNYTNHLQTISAPTLTKI